MADSRKARARGAAQPEAGTLSIDGQMVDKPHLTQALQALGLAT